MLCDKCWGMLRGHDSRQWKGTYNLNFDHHNSLESLEKSSALKCGICRVLDEEWAERLDGEPRLETDHFQSSAGLSVVDDIDDKDIYRLDFKLTGTFSGTGSVHKKTFLLQETSGSRCSPTCGNNNNSGPKLHRQLGRTLPNPSIGRHGLSRGAQTSLIMDYQV